MIDQNTGDIGNASGLGCPLLADKYRGANHMPHDPRLITDESKIEALRDTIPDWIKGLERPNTPCVVPAFGPLEGIRAVGTGQLIAQPYIGTKLAEFGAEVIHVEKPGGDVFRFTAPQLTRGPRAHGCDEAEVTKNKLSMGLDFKKARGVELLMALWKISDVWMESSAPGTLERNGITNELALAVNRRLVIVRVSTYGQYGKEDYLGRPGYDAIAQANGNTLPLFTGEGAVYGHTGNRPPGFQPYDTFKCSDGWVFIGALAGAIYDRVPRFLGLDPEEYSYDECSKDAAAVSSEKGCELDRRLRDYCAAHTAVEVETALNKAQIGCARVFNVRDQYNDEHYAAREMTAPVLDRQSGVPIRVFGVVPKMSLTPGRIWRGAPSIGDDTTDILSTMLGLSEAEIEELYAEGVVHCMDPYEEPKVTPVNP